jgi:hypothetical protein
MARAIWKLHAVSGLFGSHGIAGQSHDGEDRRCLEVLLFKSPAALAGGTTVGSPLRLNNCLLGECNGLQTNERQIETLDLN